MMAEDVGPTPAAIGCLLTIPGFFGGGMMAVLVGKVVGHVRQCTPPEGLPACDWHVYMLVGGLIGLVLLPAIVVWRLRQGRSTRENSDRS